MFVPVCVRACVCDTSVDLVPEKVFEDFQVDHGSFSRLLSASHSQRSQPPHFKAVFSVLNLEEADVPVRLNTCPSGLFLLFHFQNLTVKYFGEIVWLNKMPTINICCLSTALGGAVSWVYLITSQVKVL